MLHFELKHKVTNVYILKNWEKKVHNPSVKMTNLGKPEEVEIYVNNMEHFT